MDLRETEYGVLRQTIATRGTMRMVLFPVVMLGWAGLAASMMAFADLPVLAIFSLGVLVGGFEAIHALHVGVERIGRYVQVFYEGSIDAPRWETTAMAVGPALPGGGIDPLFTLVFASATVVNMIAAMVPHVTRLELMVVVGLHLAFVIRLARARGAAARQRAVELETFKAIKAQAPASGPEAPAL